MSAFKPFWAESFLDVFVTWLVLPFYVEVTQNPNEFLGVKEKINRLAGLKRGSFAVGGLQQLILRFLLLYPIGSFWAQKKSIV